MTDQCCLASTILYLNCFNIFFVTIIDIRISDQDDKILTFSDAEETMNDTELPDYKEDGMDVEMKLADRYIIISSLDLVYVNR
jgi:hypothetical protein